MLPKPREHIHKYYKKEYIDRKDGWTRTIWACGEDGCRHYIPKAQSASIIGRDSLCWGCGHLIKITEEIVEWHRWPLCKACIFMQEVDNDTRT